MSGLPIEPSIFHLEALVQLVWGTFCIMMDAQTVVESTGTRHLVASQACATNQGLPCMIAFMAQFFHAVGDTASKGSSRGLETVQCTDNNSLPPALVQSEIIAKNGKDLLWCSKAGVLDITCLDFEIIQTTIVRAILTVSPLHCFAFFFPCWGSSLCPASGSPVGCGRWD